MPPTPSAHSPQQVSSRALYVRWRGRVLAALMLAGTLTGVQVAASTTAEAVGVGTYDVSFHTSGLVTSPEFWISAGMGRHKSERHTLPDDLPALLHEGAPHTGNEESTPVIAQQAREAQILWRHAGQPSDSAPWFRATQQRKHAELTGRGTFLLLLFAFLGMTGVTVALWRQSGALIPARHQPSRRPRRLK